MPDEPLPKRQRTQGGHSVESARLEPRASLAVPDDPENDSLYYRQFIPIVPRSDLIAPLNSLSLSCLALASQSGNGSFAIAGPSFLTELLKRLVHVTK